MDEYKSESEWIESYKPRNPKGPNGKMYEVLLSKLRRDIDYGDFDGHGPDLLHHEAAAAIEDLLIALDSQIEICNDLRAQVERRAAPTAAPAPTDELVDFGSWFDDWKTGRGPFTTSERAMFHMVWQAARAAPATAWLPIESAPRDGTHIYAIAVSNSSGFGWPFVGAAKVHAQTVVHWFGAAFYPSQCEQDQKFPFPATHWMPLPPPPTERA